MSYVIDDVSLTEHGILIAFFGDFINAVMVANVLFTISLAVTN